MATTKLRAHELVSNSLRQRLYVQLHPPAWQGAGLSPLNTAIVLAILLGALLAILETEPAIAAGRERDFHLAELALGCVFLVELVLRTWTIVEDHDGRSNARRRISHLITPSSLIDIVVIAATFIPFIGANALVLRLVRILRVIRLARLGRFSKAMRHLVVAVSSRRYELILTMGLAATLLVFGATALYWAEGELQPDKFGSIPRSLWWSVITLTTIGYGDVYPITPLGKLIAACGGRCRNRPYRSSDRHLGGGIQRRCSTEEVRRGVSLPPIVQATPRHSAQPEQWRCEYNAGSAREHRHRREAGRPRECWDPRHRPVLFFEAGWER
jgi:voltage-gated potassium channel